MCSGHHSNIYRLLPLPDECLTSSSWWLLSEMVDGSFQWKTQRARVCIASSSDNRAWHAIDLRRPQSCHLNILVDRFMEIQAQFTVKGYYRTLIRPTIWGLLLLSYPRPLIRKTLKPDGPWNFSCWRAWVEALSPKWWARLLRSMVSLSKEQLPSLISARLAYLSMLFMDESKTRQNK